MAEPLTSTDIWRIQRGFGVSELASPEEKKRFAAAGIAPLTTGARQRLEEGRGISPMAGAAEKEAWVASEVMAGLRPESQMPKIYGGLGELPRTPKTGFFATGEETAYGRRQRRMQEEWGAQYKMMMEQQEATRQLQKEALENANRERNFLLQERQETRLAAAETKAQELASRISDDADLAMNELMGGVDVSGKPIAGLDPNDPNYMKRRNNIIKRFPLAPKDEGFKLAIATTDKSYFDKLNFEQQLQVQQKYEERMLGREERMEERQRTARQEEAAAADVAAEEKDIVSKEREIDKEIRAQRQMLAGLQGQKPTKTLEKAATEARNKLLDLRIEKADLRGLVFETQEEADAANPPKGSTIYIGRKPFKVD